MAAVSPKLLRVRIVQEEGLEVVCAAVLICNDLRVPSEMATSLLCQRRNGVQGEIQA
jgi:hypothetical protein